MQWQQYGVYNIDGYDNVLISTWMELQATIFSALVLLKYMLLELTKECFHIWYFFGSSLIFQISKFDLQRENRLEQRRLILEGTVYDTTGWINKVHAWDGDQLKEIYSGYTYASVGSVQHEVLVSVNRKFINI